MNFLIAAILLAQAQPKPQQPPPPTAEEGEWGVRGRLTFWWPDINARFDALKGANDPASDSSNVSLDKDLGLFDQEAFGVYEVAYSRFETKDGRKGWYDFVKLSFWGNEWSGSTILESQRTFNGVAFAKGETVKSEFLIWNLGLDVNLKGLEVGEGTNAAMMTGGAGLRLMDVTAAMDGPSGDADESIRLLYIGGTFDARWNHGQVFFTSLSVGLFFSFSPYRGFGWGSNNEWGAVLSENAFAFGLETGNVRVEVGLRVDANYSRVTRDRGNGEVDIFSWFLGGPFAQAAVRF